MGFCHCDGNRVYPAVCHGRKGRAERGDYRGHQVHRSYLGDSFRVWNGMLHHSDLAVYKVCD